MRNDVLFWVLIVVLIIVGLFFMNMGANDNEDIADKGCMSDSDCKLIYNSCSCEAVSVNYPGVDLESLVDCFMNECSFNNVTAGCDNKRCVKRT
jgi:hypothetical protein